MSENQENLKKSSSGIPTIIKILGIIGIIVFWYFVFYGPMPSGPLTPRTQEGNYDLMVSDHLNISEIALDIQADVGTYDIKLLPQGSQNLLDADWDLNYRIGEDAENDIEISISNTTINNTLSILVSVIHPSEEFIIIDNFNFTLYLNPDYALYGLTADLAAGSLDIETNNIIYNEFLVSANAGKIDINLDSTEIQSDLSVENNAGEIDINLNNVSIDGDMLISTNVGAIYIVIADIQLTNSTIIDVNSDVGEIELLWEQTVSLGADVIMNVDNNVGEIDIDIVATDLLMKYQVTLDTDIGSENFNHYEWDVVSGYYQSPGFSSSSADLMKITANNDVGSLDINIELQS
jgi:hypothetical protein